MTIPRTAGNCTLTLPSQPFLSAAEKRRVIGAFLRSGDLSTGALIRRLHRLAEDYEKYCAFYPYGIWTQGLVITAEMHRLTEFYLPLIDVWKVWQAVLQAGLKVPLPDMIGETSGAASWLTMVERLTIAIPMAPDRLLGRMLHDELFRESVLFSWYLPRAHGGGFNRYPEQLAWLRFWLENRRNNGDSSLSCLDAACGSGEGTYELAAAVQSAGFCSNDSCITGETLQPVEVLAAALVHFPHNRLRQETFVSYLTGELSAVPITRITFRQADVRVESPCLDRYDLILCNGLLGGPLLHERTVLLQVMRGLVARLNSGGILLADDRFHEGWRLALPREELQGMLNSAGMRVVNVHSGVGGVRIA